MINLTKIAAEVHAGSTATMTKTEILDALGQALCEIGKLWDKVEEVDILKGPATKYSTRNRQSMTYKLRKIARYSYP